MSFLDHAPGCDNKHYILSLCNNNAAVAVEHQRVRDRLTALRDEMVAADALDTPRGSRVVEQRDLSDRLELLVIEDMIYGTPTTVYEVHCWDCQGTDYFDDRDTAVRDGVDKHACRMAGEYEDE